MIKPEIYTRKTFEIEAVRVTHDNMDEVALWCLAEKKEQTRPSKKGEGGYTTAVPYLHLKVLRPLNDRQEMAFVGDWILKTGTSFKIYTDIAFHKNFEKKESYDDIMLPESETEFMVLRGGSWEPMSPQELKEKLAPIVIATMQEFTQEQSHHEDLEELRTIDEPADVPQINLSHPKTSE